jgi:succinate dehydrogenase / fumarate reductase cytochrome b subunit
MMAIERKVGFFQGLKYRGGSPMLAWMLHRITGFGLVVFVSLHVIASFFMQQTGSDLATTINIIYEHWAFQIMITFIVIYHALNGLRIALLDLWPQFQTYQREALWLQWLIFTPVYGLTVFILVQNALTAG